MLGRWFCLYFKINRFIDRSAIAHSIREQLWFYRKTLTLGSDQKLSDTQVEFRTLGVLTSCLRDGDIVDEFTPALHELTEVELEKLEQSRDREAR